MQDEDVENLVERCLLNPEAHGRLSELLLNARRIMVREWFVAVLQYTDYKGASIVVDTILALDRVLTW